VATTSSLPLTGVNSAAPYGTEEMVADGDESDFQQAHTRRVTAGYFETMGTRLLAGRTFDDADDEAGRQRFIARARQETGGAMTLENPGIAIVDELFAQRAWPGEEAVGKRVYVKVTSPPSWFEIIGVVAHERQLGLAGYSQQNIYFPDNLLGAAANSMWVVRADGDPRNLVAPIREQLRAIDAELPLARVNTMSDIVRDARASARFVLQLIGGFALVALLLAALGLYAVLAHTVRQRAGEIGVRMAFGAGSARIRRLVVRQGLVLVALGLALGIGGALLLTRVMEAMLVGVSATDPVTFVVVPVLFVLVGAAACHVPARRATRVDPMVTLRGE
jgi:putative ABC transport system permease protein